MLKITPEADAALNALYERGQEHLLNRLEDALDRLAQDPGAADVRRRRIQPAGVWAITVADWVILWKQDGDTTVVQYVGPSPF